MNPEPTDFSEDSSMVYFKRAEISGKDWLKIESFL
jgi:hypothetical protein